MLETLLRLGDARATRLLDFGGGKKAPEERIFRRTSRAKFPELVTLQGRCIRWLSNEHLGSRSLKSSFCTCGISLISSHIWPEMQTLYSGPVPVPTRAGLQGRKAVPTQVPNCLPIAWCRCPDYEPIGETSRPCAVLSRFLNLPRAESRWCLLGLGSQSCVRVRGSSSRRRRLYNFVSTDQATRTALRKHSFRGQSAPLYLHFA